MRRLTSFLFVLSLLAGCAAAASDDGAQDDGASGAAGDDGSSGQGGSSSEGGHTSASGGAGSGAGATGGGSTSGGGSSASSGGSASGGSGQAAGGGPAGGGLPCEVSALLKAHCWECHANPPSGGAPVALVSYQDLTAPSKADPTKSYAVRSLSRMKGVGGIMPPSPEAPVSAAEIAAFESWVNAGTPSTGCGPGAGGSGGTSSTGGSGGSGGSGAAGGEGGASGQGGSTGGPYDTPVTCTSNMTWTNGDSGSPLMHPGVACMSCHKLLGKATGKTFDVGGTVYPSAHEPDNCDGVGGAQVIIIDANGQEHPLDVNAAGNFYHQNLFGFANFALPIKAKVVANGKERVMNTPQMTGDCNSCHTEKGDSNAPGRIMLP